VFRQQRKQFLTTKLFQRGFTLCGIYGAINAGQKSLDMGIIRGLTLANRERGKESLGFFNSNGEMLKRGKDPIDVLTEEDCTKFLDETEQRRDWFVVGHTRYSTRGRVCDENSHPFEYNQVIGAHNGCIDAPASYSVDSEYAIDLLSQNNSDYQKALENESGYWTLAWFDKERQELFLSMYHNTCGLVKYRDIWYFSSDPDHLATVVGSRDMIKLTDGQSVSFKPDGKMRWRPKFKSNQTGRYRKNWKTSGKSSTTQSYSGYTGYGTGASSGSTTKVSGSSSNVSSSTKVADPESKIRDFDEEFSELWKQYSQVHG